MIHSWHILVLRQSARVILLTKDLEVKVLPHSMTKFRIRQILQSGCQFWT